MNSASSTNFLQQLQKIINSIQQLDSFRYTCVLSIRSKDEETHLLGSSFKNIGSVSLNSREFANYDECVSSAKRLMDDVLKKIDKSTLATCYKIGSEINPTYSGQQTLSKDWDLGEISRIWIYDKKTEKTGQICAIGWTRIFGSFSQRTEFPN